MRKSAPGQNVFKSTCRLNVSMQRKVCPLAWVSDIAILTYPAGKWCFVGNLSYRRTVSTPGNELFLFFLAGAGGVGSYLKWILSLNILATACRYGKLLNWLSLHPVERAMELTRMSMAFCSKTHRAGLEGQLCLGNVSNFHARMCDRVLFLMFYLLKLMSTAHFDWKVK